MTKNRVDHVAALDRADASHLKSGPTAYESVVAVGPKLERASVWKPEWLLRLREPRSGVKVFIEWVRDKVWENFDHALNLCKIWCGRKVGTRESRIDPTTIEMS